jgi:lipoprotein NlpI
MALLPIAAALALSASWLAEGPSQSPETIAELAEAEFVAGRVEESVAAFDRLAALVPSVAPTLWQRGIGLYILGRFRECAAQFADFHRIDPTDLENASWHFLCVARAESVDRARAGLLAAGPDARILRTQIYEMLAGRRTADDLMGLAAKSTALVQFYGHLYVGLYQEASGQRAAALEHLSAAASDQYAPYGGFMNVVARVYLARLSR